MTKHPKKDILAEAIADAKKVRQTAFEHAKIQMQEAFMPKLQNVFKEKMKQQDEDEFNDDIIFDDEIG